MSEAVRWGMVGGGQGAFIGAVHRSAAAIDGLYALRAGALSSEPSRARRSAASLGLAPGRSYGSWREMLEGERLLPAGERIEAVSIVTPNNTHYEIARGFVDAGFHVIIDKPMTMTVEQARELVEATERSRVIAAVTYTYSGYPMVRQAAEMIRDGAIGDVRRVCVEYHQGWLATALEQTGHKQASWRADPAQAGAGGAIGDIGAHAAHLLNFVTGLRIEALCAELTAFVPGRRLDDDAGALLRLEGGARATLSASQICIGEENNLSIRVYGESGALIWSQESPDALEHRRLDGLRQTITRGSTMAGRSAAAATRLPGGHPEGFIEALANIYKDVACAIVARRAGEPPVAEATYPTAVDGLRGVEFIEWMVTSARAGGWISRKTLDNDSGG